MLRLSRWIIGLIESRRPLPDDGQKDVEGYNKELEALGPPSWLSVPWLFSECYLYRQVTHHNRKPMY
jgi:hypothetical protein